MNITKTLQHKYALSLSGAHDMEKAFFACTLFNISLMLPVSVLYFFISDLMNKTEFTGGRITLYIIGIAVCLVLVYFSCKFQYYATFFATYKESGKRRISLAEKLRKIPLSFFGKKDLTELTGTIMNDCARLETAGSHWIPELIGSIISTVLVAVSLFFFNWKMALAALWVLPISFIIVISSASVQRNLGRKSQKAKNECADGIQECLETLKDIKAANYENKYMNGLSKKIKNVEKRAIYSELGASVFVASAQMLLKFGIPTTAIVGADLLIKGEINILTFFMFLIVVSRIYDPMQVALQNLLAVISCDVQCERMNEIFEHPLQTGSETLNTKGYDIKFENVGFSYNSGETVLKDVSFTAKQGEVTALIGPSGGGKTTVSRLAARFWDITKGKITVGGQDISKVDPETLLGLYSIVFQDVTLFNNTILENIRIGRKDATDEEVINAAKEANCLSFIEKLPDGINIKIGENGSSLSGGERQRISIARAFLKNSPIILLDEATASLDVENETKIQESLSKLIKDKTVLIIAHRMRTVMEADKIVVLKDGIVAEEGTPKELTEKNGIFAHMSQMQSEGMSWTLK